MRAWVLVVFGFAAMLFRRSVFRVFAVACAIALSGCASDGPDAAAPSQPTAPATPPPSSTVVIDDQSAENADQPKTEVFEGNEKFVATPPKRPGGGGGDISLDFADADVKDVIRTVLGEMLKVPYTIDPQVQGKVTLRTNRPLRRVDVIAALETALKVNNAVIVLADNIYNVVPAADAQKRVDGFELSGSPRSRLPGYGVEIVPLRYIAAGEMQKLLQPVAPAGGVLSVDTARNLVFLAGTRQERASMLDTIRLFDLDYMKGMSYALVRPEHLEAQALADELKRVFDTTAGANASLLRFVPLARLNTLLVVSPRASYLSEVTKWVDRLDVPQRGPARGVYFYRMQNAKAEDVARSLAAVYGGAVNLGASEGTSGDVPPPDGANDPSQPPPAVPSAPNFSRPSGNGSGMQIALDAANNALIIRAGAADYAGLERFLKEIDIAPDQVLIEVTIAEVTLNDSLRYGVEWFFRNADQTYNFGRSANPSSSFPGFSFTYTVPDIDVVVNALDNVTDVRVISAPKLLTLDNKTATLQVGDQVPVITQSATGVRDANDPTIVNSVQFRDTGIVLKVTPRIGKSGAVFVDVNQEVSSAIPTTTSGIDSPTIQQRKLSSTVAVQDGDAIALGGLMRQSETQGEGGVPLLKDIPLLGKAFSNTSQTSDRTELLIFLKPRIIRSPAAAREVTDSLRQGLTGLDTMMQNADEREQRRQKRRRK
ncbi:MAG: type II secretion system secretin GspD [Alphaproteobacteria bacterium]|nr:type II secretion system secretin GspD [Alphaproteobacteria bacterium]